MAIVHPVGDPKDPCEEKVITHLKNTLSKQFHIYHNLELVVRRTGHPYEYDLIIVGRFAIWVIEVKGYRGAIRGNATTWELANGRFERSPIPLTNEKAKVLKSHIVAFAPQLEGNVYVDSFVVLCNKFTTDKLNDPQSERILYFADLPALIMAREKPLANSHHSSNLHQIVREMLDQWFKPLVPKGYIGDYIVEDTMSDRSALFATYPARHRLIRTSGRISLKVFQLDTDLPKEEMEKQKEFCVREAEALTLIGDHPNIVRCFPPFLWEADKIIVPLEWVDGPNLRDYLDKGIDWDISHRLGIFRQICAGLLHAHQHGVLHRMLAPANIIIMDNGRVRIVNFKCAKIMEASNYGLPSIKTKDLFHSIDPKYMAPELSFDVPVSLHKATRQSDIYSAGIILFELLTCRHPFSDSGIPQYESDITVSTFLDAEDRQYFTEQMVGIYRKMCAYRPEARYNSLESTLADLSQT
jgi:hypothetical protein